MGPAWKPDLHRPELPQYRQELGYPGRGDVPDLVEVHSDVIMTGYRAFRRCSSSRVAPCSRGLGRNAFGRLADHLQVPDDGVLQFLGHHECRTARLDEAGNSAATLDHVVQI